jgi:hypothetical protein
VSDDNTGRNSPFTSRGFIAAAIIVGVIILAAVIVLVTSLTAPHDPVAKPTSTSSSPVASGGNKSVCGLTGFETKSSLTAAPPTKWQLVGTVASPTDPKGAGPGTIESDGFRSCFAHTATGALYAAVNFLALGTDGTLRPRLTELVANGPGKNASANSSSTNSTSTNTRAQAAGFKIDAYDASSATVDLALNYNTGSLVSLPVKLVWEAGDWKLVLTDSGELPLKPAQLQSLGGYIPWAGA